MEWWIQIISFALSSWILLPIFLKATVLKPPKCKSKRRLDGKVCLVTGANSGLGKITTADLAARGALVYMACRNVESAEKVRQYILSSNPSAKLKVVKLDLGSLSSVKQCAQLFLKAEDKLDILVANAGFGSFRFNLSEDGIEWHMACNHLGHFYLTRLLLPCLEKAASSSSKSRVVVVSSVAHAYGPSVIQYDKLQNGNSSGFAYGQSKLANLFFVKYMHNLLSGRNVTINGLHPGVVNTHFLDSYITRPVQLLLAGIFYPITHLFIMNEEEGAQTQIWASVAEELEGVSGKYIQSCSIRQPSKSVDNMEEAEKLWRWSCSKTRLPLDL